MKHLKQKYLILLGVLCLWLANSVAAAPKPLWQNGTSLVPGTTIERELRGGDVHTYQIHLNAGQFLDAVVEQKGIDVVVTTYGVDGNQLAHIDSPNGAKGNEPVVVFATTTGDYRIQVSASDKQSGQYTLRGITVRDATLTDKNRIAAEKLFEEAQSLRLQRKADTYRQASEKYQQSLAFYKSSGNLERQALTNYIIGSCLANLGEFRQASSFLTQAHSFFYQLGDREMEAITVNFLGGVLDILGDLPNALESYNRALGLARTSGNKVTEVSILNNIGKIYIDLTEPQTGLDYYNNALTTVRNSGDKKSESLVLHNIGTVLYLMGDLDKSLQSYQQALSLRQAIKDQTGEARTLQGMGTDYFAMVNPLRALEYFTRALPLHRAVGDRYGEANTLKFVGDTLSVLGQKEKALEALQQSLQLRRALEDKRGEGLTLESLGAVHLSMGQPQKALEYYNPALANFRSVGDLQNEAKSLQGIAHTERDRGNLEVALQQIKTAISLYENVRTKVNSQQSRASYFAVQQTAYQFYTDLLMQLHQQIPSAGHDAAALQITERARARSLLELLAESNVDFRQGVDVKLLDRERELMQQINAKAARLMQRNSVDKIAELKKEISALEDEYQQAQTTIRKSNPQYANVTQPQPLSVPAIQKELDENTLLLEYALGEERSFVWAVTNHSLTSYELPKQSEIKPVAQQVYEALTARTLVVNGETPPVRQARIAQADSRFTEASTKLSELLLAPVASQLGNKRLVIVADGALQYVPFGALPEMGVGGRWLVVGKKQNQPPATNHQPLILNHEIITLPSASVIGVMRKELAGRTVAPKMLAVIADPVFSSNDERAKVSQVKLARAATVTTEARGIVHTEEKPADTEKMSGGLKIPRLPYTHLEADQIYALAPKATSFRATDFKASRATVTDPELGKYRYLHFATHGLLDSEKPGLSSLVLSMLDEQGNPQDGFFRAHELYNLKLPAELVVLSACQTGLGKEIKGEGLVGLTRGFMYAGAARVIVSLWSVNDKATAELMTKLYQSMLQKGESPAAALRSAQVAMWKQKQWNAPYYWAAFTLQGEWR